MTEENILFIIAFFGKDKQKVKAIEECLELIKAICKEDVENIKEEIADVKIMIAQLMEIYNIDPEEVFKIMDKKIDRTIKRINAEPLAF